ncbi:hypothetical protein BYT27DRAFT_7181414 [Phlegmacium glaucopus]|nr:hypothetical protein BYT27DRAFT_7181414 [Phlegmacium glaucopus]
MQKEVQAKTDHMEKSVRVAEREYSKKMMELNRGFEAPLALTCAASYLCTFRHQHLLFRNGESNESGQHNSGPSW